MGRRDYYKGYEDEYGNETGYRDEEYGSRTYVDDDGYTRRGRASGGYEEDGSYWEE